MAGTAEKEGEEAAASEVEWSAGKVRQTFIDFFKEKHQHDFVVSSPVVPLDDPTLLFCNAGMNQFKPVFLGQADPSSRLASLKRAVNTQKCIRAGGKHNDLDDVGKDTYHHTFFEMMGTWSFGDYFKEEAIAWAWDLLTNVYKLPTDRLYATYCEGNEHEGGTVPADEETRQLWLKYLPEDRVLKGSMKDNFWEMGDVGPCGPCTELHFDRVGGRNAAHLVNMDDPDVVEFWNIVFMQFNREEGGALKLLPAQHVDTGMGFERLVSMLQDRRSNYDTDLFSYLFSAIQAEIGCEPYGGRVGPEDKDFRDTAYRVLADHARTLSFAIADGAVPSNEGRGYVLRRILRRAVRYGQQMLGAHPGFMSKLIPAVVSYYKDIFPELTAKQSLIVATLEEEEAAFEKMLTTGIKWFETLAEGLVAEQQDTVQGADAFFLYDTMGFPVDLTELMAEEKGLRVDVKGFEQCMAQQKQRSKEAAAMAKGGGGKAMALGVDETAALAKMGIGATADEGKYVWEEGQACAVQAVYLGDGEFLKEGEAAEEGVRVGVVLDATSFYAEAGGQVGDTGTLKVGDAQVQVEDTQSFAGYVLHVGRVREGALRVKAEGTAHVDYTRRKKIAPNHSMTHVLNLALLSVLGGSVDQKGSLCDHAKLRFDFTAKRALTEEQLQQVEDMCAQQIQEELAVEAQVVPLAQAMALPGLRAVFGEQYPDPVRVLSIGANLEGMLAGSAGSAGGRSVELCGGTHLSNTREALAFCLVQEEAVAKGVRRISALTGEAAVAARAEGARLARALAAAEEVGAEAPLELEACLTSLRQELDQAVMSAAVKMQLRRRHEVLAKRFAQAQKEAANARANALIAAASLKLEGVGEQGWAVVEVEAADAKVLKSVLQALGKAAPGKAIMLVSAAEGKASCLTLAPKDCKVKANEWLSAALAAGGGRGGGKADSAQGQLPDASKLQEVKAKAEEYAKELLA